MPKGIYKRTEEHRINIGLGHRGIKYSKESRKKMSKSQRQEKNGNWKGNKVGYKGLHIWVGKSLGKIKKCFRCGTTKAKWYHYANISGKYRRELWDFMPLCVKCHRAYDRKNKHLTGYDLDGCITKGLFPEREAVIITGRSWQESEKTYKYLKRKSIYNAVYFNPVDFKDKNPISSAEWKSKMIKMLKVGIFFEDEPLQIKIIKEKVSECIVNQVK